MLVTYIDDDPTHEIKPDKVMQFLHSGVALLMLIRSIPAVTIIGESHEPKMAACLNAIFPAQASRSSRILPNRTLPHGDLYVSRRKEFFEKGYEIEVVLKDGGRGVVINEYS
jgi:hypothetical protein